MKLAILFLYKESCNPKQVIWVEILYGSHLLLAFGFLVRVGLFNFRIIRVGMFRNRLETRYFSVRIMSSSDRVSIFLQKTRSGTALQIIRVWFKFKAQKTKKKPKTRVKLGKPQKNIRVIRVVQIFLYIYISIYKLYFIYVKIKIKTN